MENKKQMALEILVAAKNNPKTPAEEFYKIFDSAWLEYRRMMISLYNKGLLIHTGHDQIPDLTIWKLTQAGRTRLAELLFERTNDLSKKISVAQPLSFS